jgi:hypothetical protein
MTYNSRLFNEPKLRAVVDLTDSISAECQAAADALADYQNAADEPTAERAEIREMARETAFQAIGDLLAEAAKLRVIRDSLELPS